MKVFILASILAVASCASLDTLAYLPPSQRSPSPNPLSNQYLPATGTSVGGNSGSFSFNQNGAGLSSGALGGSSNGNYGGSGGSFSFNQNAGSGLSSGLFKGSSGGNFGGAQGSLSFNQNAGSGLSSSGSFGGSNSGNIGHGKGSFSFNQNGVGFSSGNQGAFGSANDAFKSTGFNLNQAGQTGFRASSNQQGLSTNYGGYSGAGNALGQTDFKKNVAGANFGGTAFGQAAFKNQASSGYSASGGYASGGSAIPIVKLATDNNGDGTYRYSYEAANSITAEEQGDARSGGTKAQGSFGYSAPDGQRVSISYTADENGFVPQGSHIPTPPPIPEAILKSIQENVAAAARGNYNAGAYHGENVNTASYNSNAGSGFGGSSAFQAGSFGANNFQANAANNGGYKY